MLAGINRFSPKSARLKNKVSGENFVLAYSSSDDKRVPRFAISVSQAVAKKAVERNRTRRLIAASVIKLLPKLEAGYFLIIAKTNLADCGLDLVSNQIAKLFQKAGVLR